MPGTTHGTAGSRRRVRSVLGLAAAAAAVAGGAAVAVPATAAAPATPTGLSAVVHGHDAYLKWKSSGDTAYTVQQARDATFSTGLRTYAISGPGHVFTPYGLSPGTLYYFRVRAVDSGATSHWTSKVSLTAPGATSAVRVLTYNTLAASKEGEPRPGGTVPSFDDRRSGLLDHLSASNADVIGVQEAATCLHTVPHAACYRQIDSLAEGLDPQYTLADTTSTSSGTFRYAGNYLLYRNTVDTVGTGGSWAIGDKQYAAYQLFRVAATNAEFLVVNVHLKSGNSSADQMRGAETDSMLTHAESYASGKGVTSIVYIGDFNTYVDLWNANDISGNKMRAANVPDGVEVAQHRYKAKYDSFNGYGTSPRKGHGSIDHVYATPGVGLKAWGERLTLKDGKFVGTIPSDHNPVWADLAIPN